MSFADVATGNKKKKDPLDEVNTYVQAKLPEETQEKPSVFTRVFNALSAFEPGDEVATLIETKDPIKAGKQYGSEVLRGVGSLAPFLDKYTKPVELERNKQGFKRVANLAGVPEEGIWDDLLGLAGDIALDPSNLFLAGAIKGVGKGGKALLQGGSKALRIADKTQDISKAVKVASEAEEVASAVRKTNKLTRTIDKGSEILSSLGKAFIPGFSQPESYKSARQLYKDLLEYNKLVSVEKGAEFARKLPDEESFVKVIDWIESGGKAEIDDALKPVAQNLKSSLDKIKEAESSRGILKAEVKDYFPHIRTDKPALAPFEKPISTNLGAAKGRKLEGTIQEINDAFGKEFFETNPARAYTIRSLASQKAVTAHDFLESVKTLGDDVIAKVGDAKAQTNGFVDTGIKNLDGFLVHPEVAKDLKAFTASIKNDESMNAALKLFDNVQNLWKKSVTVYFPAFHARNGFSNVFMNWLAGVNNPTVYKTALDVANGKTGQVASRSYDEVLDLAKRTGVITQGFFSKDVGVEIAERAGKKNLPQRILGFAGKLGTGVENNARLALFIDQLKKGVEPEAAAKTVKKFLFDYSDLTTFEKEVMRRVFPFYTWTRKAIPLITEQLLTQPTKFKAIGDTRNSLLSSDLTEEEKALIPDYISKSLGVQIGRNKSGDPRFLAGLGLPFEALERPTNPSDLATDMLSPLIKFPLEKATGVNFFTKKQISEDPYLNKTTKLIGNTPILKQFLQAEETKDGMYVNPERMHLLRTVFGRALSTAEQLSKENRALLIKIINAFSGAKVYDVDIDAQRYFKEKAQFEDVAKDLLRKGEIKKFERYYVPKESKSGGFGSVSP